MNDVRLRVLDITAYMHFDKAYIEEQSKQKDRGYCLQPGWMALFCLLLLSLVATTVRAQVPRLLSYQGVLVEQDLVAVPDATYVVTIRLYEVAGGGTPVWEETQSVETLDGVFDAILGLRTPLDIPFDRQYWLSVQLQGEVEMAPRTMVVAAPYALRAEEASIADSLRGGVVRSINNLQGNLTIEGASGTTVTENGNRIIISSGGGVDPTLSPGAIWYGDQNSEPTERQIGDPRQVLNVNAAGTEPEWTSSIDVQSVKTDSLEVTQNAYFETLPDFPLGENDILVGSSNNRVTTLPSTNTPNAVLRLDPSGKPTWQPLASNPTGRVPTIGQIRQTVPQTAVQANSKIRVSYEDPAGGAYIALYVLGQNAGADFTVQFTALPPPNTFIIYEIIP